MARGLTHAEFVDKVHDLVGDEYTVASTYEKSSVKVKLKHNVCGESWDILPGNFYKGKRCPTCAGKRKFKGQAKFEEDVKVITNGNLEVVGTYTHCETLVKVRCKIHSIAFEALPTSILRGRKVCKACNATYLSEVQRKSDEDFQKELLNKHKGLIVCEGAYINTHTKTPFKCLGCSTEFTAEPNSVLRLSGCPQCASSKGEKAIVEYLKSRGIEFIAQKTFADCKRTRPLPFDVFIPSLNLLVEYHGKQHYEPIEFFGGLETFENQVVRDKIKSEYAKVNGITLLVIPYTITGDNIHKEIERYL